MRVSMYLSTFEEFSVIFSVLKRKHRYHVVACFTKTLQKQDIYRHIHGNCANNPVWWTNYNIGLFMIYNRFQVCMKRNSNFRATFAHEEKWSGNSNFAS